MKKYVFITTLLAISSLLLSGCMTTGPIVDDLNHYKKGDTYEKIREGKGQSETINESKQENLYENIEIDYGTSDIFSKEEMDEVMNLVLNTYETWSSHPQVYKMYYDSDEMSLYELNYFEESLGLKFDKCLKIYSNFYMDLDEPENTFQTDNITGYSWTACKYEGREWDLVNHGFM